MVAPDDPAPGGSIEAMRGFFGVPDGSDPTATHTPEVGYNTKSNYAHHSSGTGTQNPQMPWYYQNSHPRLTASHWDYSAMDGSASNG